MRKAGNPGRPGNGSPGKKTLFSTPLNVDHQVNSLISQSNDF